MRRSLVAVVVAMSAGVSVSARVGEVPRAKSGELTVHEWGTFTSVAGTDGRAIDWLPLGGPSDLPCFVQHVGNDPLVKTLSVRPAGTAAAVAVASATYDVARRQMAARVRMETPAPFFYLD